MTVSRQVCPFHADEDIHGVPTGSGDGSLSLPVCERGAIRMGARSPGCMCRNRRGCPASMATRRSLAWQPNCLRRSGQYRGHWIEYGIAERAYALQCPDDFAAIVSRYGHTAVRPKQYTTSAFLFGVLGVLSKHRSVLYHLGPATGRWKYNGTISWWAVPPAPDWESSRLSWSDIGQDMFYVPGAADTST